MIVVRVELHSAVTRQVTEIARMQICNAGNHPHPGKGNYFGQSFFGRDQDTLNKGRVSRSGRVEDYPRQAIHVWNLVARMLRTMGYTK